MCSTDRDAAAVPLTVAAALAALGEAVDALQASDWTRCTDDDVLAVVRELEVQHRRLPTVDHALLGELEVRSLAARHLHRSTAHLLAELLHLDLPQARSRVRAAAELGPRTTVTGEPTEPAHPATAAAQAAGLISAEHAAVVTRALGALPSALDPEVTAAAEATLAEHAQQLPPRELGRAAERLQAHLDPDGRLTDDADRARRRHLTLGAQGSDGMSPVRGLLDPTCRALVDAAFAALARPAGRDDAPDPRSAGQRHHDALAALCQQLLADGSLPSSRGLAATVVVTMTLDQLESALGARAGRDEVDPVPPAGTTARSGNTADSSTPLRSGTPVRSGALAPVRSRAVRNPDGATARTATGTLLPLPDALRLAADAHWVLGVVDHSGQPLFLSRSSRLATPAERLALVARDRGCTRPGCDAPPSWTEVHHLTEWRHGGPTDVDNLALVCSYDHHLITDEGYTVRMGRRGRVEWIAPRHLDPDGIARTNPLHHPPDLRDLRDLRPPRAA